MAAVVRDSRVRQTSTSGGASESDEKSDTVEPNGLCLLAALGAVVIPVENLEAALREANRKFERRFRAIENDPGFAGDLDAKEALWQAAKLAQSD